MKTLALLLTMVVAMVSLPARSDARENAGNDETAKPKQREQGKESAAGKKVRLWGMHAQMVKVCNLNEEQQKQIAELNDLRQKAMKEFEAENIEKLKTLKAQKVEARKNKDKKALEEASAQLSDLLLKRKEIDSQWQAKIMGVLTEEQKAQWDRYQAKLLINKMFKNAKLTDEQVEQVANAHEKFMTDVDLSDKKARHEALQKLTDYIRAEILTDAQRAATTRPGKKAATRPGASEKPAKVKETKGESEDQ